MNRDEETVAQLCRQLHSKSTEYEEAARNRAYADATYRQARAKRVLQARYDDGARSVAEAETMADADDKIAHLRLQHLIADGVCDGLTKSMSALRTRIDVGRSLLATQREADKLMATSREVP